MRRNDEFLPARHFPAGTHGVGGPFAPFKEFERLPFFAPGPLLRQMQDEVDRFFGPFFATPAYFTGFPTLEELVWAPVVDFGQTEKEWFVEVELPGVKKDDIEVQIQNHTLVLRAKLEQVTPPETPEPAGKREYFVRERRYGSFERLFRLPETVDEAGITCEFKDGVLIVHLPKTAMAQQKVRKLPIHEVAPPPKVTVPKPETVPPPTVSTYGNGKREPAIAGAKGGVKVAPKAVK
jgi:HSP20 family protein